MVTHEVGVWYVGYLWGSDEGGGADPRSDPHPGHRMKSA